jgi:hypothetical protein
VSARKLGKYRVVEDDGASTLVLRRSDALTVVWIVFLVATAAVALGTALVSVDVGNAMLVPSVFLAVIGLVRASRVAARGALTVVRRSIEVRVEKADGGYRAGGGKVVIVDGLRIAAGDVRDVRSFFVPNARGPRIENLYLVVRNEAFKVEGSNDKRSLDELGQRLADAIGAPFVRTETPEPVAMKAAPLVIGALFLHIALTLAPMWAAQSVRDLAQLPLEVALGAGAFAIAADLALPRVVGVLLAGVERDRARAMFS